MGTLFLDRPGLTLAPEKGAIVVYENGRRRRTVPLALVDRVVVRAETELRSTLLGALAELGVGLVVLGARRLERTAILLGRPHADVRIRLGQYRLALDPAACAAFARRLVAAKARAQLRALARACGVPLAAPRAAPLWSAAPPGDAHVLRQAEAVLAPAAARLAAEPLALGEILGLEGACAAAYFRALAHLLPAALGFAGRNRRPPRDPVNACLSLAYTLLHFDAVRAAHAAGLDPLLGFFHRPAYGRESLASDLVEPLRPRADLWVWKLFRRRDLRPEHFARSNGACLLGKAGRQRFYAAFEAFAPLPRRWLRRQAAALAATLGASVPALPGRFDGPWEDEP